MENKRSNFSISSIIERKEKMEKSQCKHDYIQGDFMGYDSSSTDNEMYLFTCSKCNHSHVFYPESYFEDFLKEKKEIAYRLEFNESRQTFHLDNYTHEENTFGWFTICDITDKEFKLVMSFFNAFNKNKKTNYQVHKFINELLILVKNKNEEI